ncbi:MAG: thioredoxin family protein [Sphingobacteriales bacterium]|nr:thioredoxin family protein [Sphingobacteriales bacterium]
MKLKIKHYILPLLIFLFEISPAQPYIDKDSIFQKSIIENKTVLIVFSGSDWCKNCIQFEKGIMKDSSFQHFVRENLLLLKADFPQKKKLPEKLIRQNELLAERYNPNGIFPLFILVSPNQRTATISFQHETAAGFTDKLKAAMESILP